MLRLEQDLDPCGSTPEPCQDREVAALGMLEPGAVLQIPQALRFPESNRVKITD